jgi:DNA-damage-inducible protein J
LQLLAFCNIITKGDDFMAKTANVYIRIDPKIKAEVENIYANYGISLTDAVNIFLHQSINIGGLPFELHHKQYEITLEEAGSAMGSLKKYANENLIKKEKGAWQRAVQKIDDA